MCTKDNKMESIALLHIILSCLVLMLLLWVCNQISKKFRPRRPYLDKGTTYESGAEPVGNARSPLNSQVYVLGLIFLLFEIETMLLFPWALVYAQTSTYHASLHLQMAVVGTIFILVLGIGWVYVMHNWKHIVAGDIATIPSYTTSIIPANYYESVNEKYAHHLVSPHQSTAYHDQ